MKWDLDRELGFIPGQLKIKDFTTSPMTEVMCTHGQEIPTPTSLLTHSIGAGMNQVGNVVG
ncbi:hypothetical protein ABEU82_23800 [Brevibacillus laterosporus]|nr:hypothetical protein [Brevibacillus halotolerans]